MNKRTALNPKGRISLVAKREQKGRHRQGNHIQEAQAYLQVNRCPLTKSFSSQS